MNKWLAVLPSTNAVVACGILIALTTAARYQLSGVCLGPLCIGAWTPADSWLVFVAAVMGVATTQFGVKRVTWQGDSPEKPDIEDQAAQKKEGV